MKDENFWLIVGLFIVWLLIQGNPTYTEVVSSSIKYGPQGPISSGNQGGTAVAGGYAWTDTGIIKAYESIDPTSDIPLGSFRMLGLPQGVK